ncbi:hypothetical protein LF1_25720 [Rubripirellula obstinata]|uniref:Uncharacterized protein n=1 Tax=Rubripirellula obstinata TaxID=406547 RepID=A0A5B1CL31_9BACT|nr:hypothetical protein [Rubripirellula obstinata]KAA1260034.1 hypothetical protein LF1_25720 [Rubripirellula obstinata]
MPGFLKNRRTAQPGIKLDRYTLAWCVGLTLFIELVCVVLRFGFNQSSSVATASTIGVITFGYRVHHGYIGALLIPIGILTFSQRWSWGWVCFVAGVGLFASDAIHHFLVLWPITGSPQFDLVYPSSAAADE